MRINARLTRTLGAILLGLSLSTAQADPLELIPDTVTPEISRLMSCFTCQRVRQATEGDCLDDIRNDGSSTWAEELSCYFRGLLAEQDCLGALQCL